MSIPAREQKLVAQRSGNRCAFRDCRRRLTADETARDRIAELGEIAHIVAERPDGPRGHFPLPLAERNRYPNLILLCTQHHQQIDAQPQTFTVERLHAIKEEHERWVERTLGRGTNEPGANLASALVSEVVYSTLLQIEHMPRWLYSMPCAIADEREVATHLRLVSHREMAPFILRGGRLIAFQDLNLHDGPFADLARSQPVERNAAMEWWDDPDRFRWFMDLCNRALNKLTGRRGLLLDKRHHRYYFAPDEPGKDKEIRYRPLNQASGRRKVVWQPANRQTGEGRGYWYHRAVSLRFLRIGPAAWCLRLRPELRVTLDGVNTPPSDEIGRRVSRKLQRIFNYDLLGDVNFWRDYLSESRPRIILPFGGRQRIIIGTSLMEGTVIWPGIPEEHAKPFRNVEYADDLFSWAEYAAPGLEDDHDEIDEEGEDDGDEAFDE